MLTYTLTGTLNEIIDKLPSLLSIEPNLNEDTLRLDLLDKYPNFGVWHLSPNNDYNNLPLFLKPYLPHTHHHTNNEAQKSLRQALLSWAKDQLQPVSIYEICAGDIVRAEWSYLESGTRVRVEGEVIRVGDEDNIWIKTYTEDDDGDPNWEIWAEQALDGSTSAATYYMIKKGSPPPAEQGTLLTTEQLHSLPLGSYLKVQYKPPGATEETTMEGTLKARYEDQMTGYYITLINSTHVTTIPETFLCVIRHLPNSTLQG